MAKATPTPPAPELKEWLVNTPLNVAGKQYKLGDKVKLPDEIAASIPQGVISPAVETADEKAVRLEAERQAREDATAEVDEKYDRR